MKKLAIILYLLYSITLQAKETKGNKSKTGSKVKKLKMTSVCPLS
jgi:hypothetical protein